MSFQQLMTFGINSLLCLKFFGVFFPQLLAGAPKISAKPSAAKKSNCRIIQMFSDWDLSSHTHIHTTSIVSRADWRMLINSRFFPWRDSPLCSLCFHLRAADL